MKAIIVIGDTDRYEKISEKEKLWNVMKKLSLLAFNSLVSQGYTEDEFQ